jgi:hypothetical protein
LALLLFFHFKNSMMKTELFLIVISMMFRFVGQAQQIDLSMQQSSAVTHQLEVKLRPREDIVQAAYSGGVFTIRVPIASGQAINLVPESSPFGFSFAGPVTTHEGYDYYRFQFAGFVHQVSWLRDKEYPVIILSYTGGGPPAAELVSGNSWTRANNADYYQELDGQAAQGKFYRRLPRMISFEAELQADKSIILSWAIAPTDMLQSLSVEHSTDGQQFVRSYSLESIPGVIDFPMYNTYYFREPGMFYFFRIRMEDKSGQVSYSETRMLIREESGRLCKVFPNPVDELLSLTVPNDGPYQYQLVSSSGVLLLGGVLTQPVSELSIGDYPSGQYYLLLFLEGKPYCASKVSVQP